jgi:phosphate starvation-inducible protein PhoH and related proteins
MRKSKNRDSYTPSTPDIRRIFPKNDNQQKMLDSIQNNHITFVNGFAGTGKTLLSVYSAIMMLEARQIDQIVYIKPNVDMQGERGIGFLKGEIEEKLAPLLLPLLDNLKVFCSPTKARYLVDKGIIKVELLEYLRGRSLDRTFVIFDEAQNCRPHGVLTALTRMTDDSRIVVMGDLMQCDIELWDNGLRDAFSRYVGCKSVGFVKFEDHQWIYRNSFIKDILKRNQR